MHLKDTRANRVKVGLAPVIDAGSKVLILGTLPSDESIRLGQYYANKTNQFWGILEAVYGDPIGSEYSERLQFLRIKRLALWDVLRSAERSGSSDREIKNPMPNDFAEFFQRYGELIAIVFNGSKAQEYYGRKVRPRLREDSGAPSMMIGLPSTSSAQGRYVLPLEEKVIRWKSVVDL